MNALWCRSLLPAFTAVAATLGLHAQELQLQTTGLSPKGNLAFQVRGTNGTPVIVEASPDLVSWVSRGSLVLTQGTAGFFLPPGEDFGFLRVRSVDVSELPSAPTITPKVNPDFTKTRFEFGDGQVIKTTDDNGYTYQITLAADSVSEPTTLRTEIINQASGLPAGWTYLTGVQISPFNARLLGASQVVITAPAGKPFGTIAAIAWATNGTEVHLVPATVTSSEVTIPLSHFGGFGLCSISGPASGPIAASQPADSLARTEQRVALSILGGDTPGRRTAVPLVHRDDGNDRPQKLSPAGREAQGLVEGILTSRMRSALYSDEDLESTLSDYAVERRWIGLLLENPNNAPLAQVADTFERLAIQAIEASMQRAYLRCQPGNIRAMLRLYRAIRLTRNGPWARTVSLAQRERYRDLFHQAARFKVELLSSTAYTLKGGPVITSVSSEITISHPDTDFGTGRTKINGTGTLTIDSTSWDSPPSGCSATPSPASGTASIYDLWIFSNDVLDFSRIIRTDDQLSVPQIGFLWDPFTPPAAETYTLSCAGFPVQIPGGFWAAAFGTLHQGEIQKTDDGRQLLAARGTNYDIEHNDYRKQYQQSGSVGSGSATENTTLIVKYLGTSGH